MPKNLDKILESENLTDDLLKGYKEDAAHATVRAFEEYQMDLDSRSDWEDTSEEAIKIAEQIWEKKNTPWEGASNVKYPLISIASIQFNARSYPQIVNNEIVKAKVIGLDNDGKKRDRAKRIQTHMNYQLLEEMQEWEEGMDKLLCTLPVLGSVFKKSYFNPVKGRNESRLCLPQDIVVHNDKTESMETARRVTHRYRLWKNEVVERQRGGLWRSEPLKLVSMEMDEQGPFEFLEQHRWLDLDGDGYEEPYTVTLAKESQELARIAPRFFLEDVKRNAKNQVRCIEAHNFFTKYSFLPSFSGKFYDLGFGQLLMGMSATIDTAINQLIDAGTLSNMQGGVISKGLNMRSGKIEITPGEWQVVNTMGQDLRQNIFPWPYKEPSAVLFQLLGLMIEVGKQLSSVSEVLSGEQSGTNVPATTTLALIEQGLKVFTAINKRVWRALKGEFKLLFELNGRFLDQKHYFQVLDEQHVVARADYESKSCDVHPVADPNAASDIQRMIRAEALMKTIGLPGAADPYDIMHEYYEALKVPNMERFHPPKEKLPPTPPPIEQLDLESKMKERQAKLPLELKVLESEALLNFAKADEANAAESLEQLKLKVDALMQLSEQQMALKQQQMEMQQQEEAAKNEAAKAEQEAMKSAIESVGTGLEGVAPAPSDEAGVEGAEGETAGGGSTEGGSSY